MTMTTDSTTTNRGRMVAGRRRVLAGAAALAGAAVLGFPAIRTRAAQTLKVGTYGGYFKDSFDQHIYPDFTKETGIEIESIAEPTGEAWLVQLQTAAGAGVAPADVSMMAQVTRLKGENAQLWTPLDDSKLPNTKNLVEHFVKRYPDGKVSSLGAVSWYVTLVTNTDVYPEAPTPGRRCGTPPMKARSACWRWPAIRSLLEITAVTWFGGTDILNTEDGITKVLEKLAEVKPNVASGTATRDSSSRPCRPAKSRWVSTTMTSPAWPRRKGQPVRSTFPQEGGVPPGSWCVSGPRRRSRRRTSSSTICAVRISRRSCRARSAPRRR
jgi:putative spermidine/putrescine transport system substrate-binding protein